MEIIEVSPAENGFMNIHGIMDKSEISKYKAALRNQEKIIFPNGLGEYMIGRLEITQTAEQESKGKLFFWMSVK